MKKVMIVDDNTLSAQGIIENIDWKSLDAEITHVKYDGSSAIQAIKETSVDLIISDIKMPDLDGISMSKQALLVNPLVKIILISAYNRFEYAKRAIQLGVFDYIEKPLDYPYLTEKIKKAFQSLAKEEKNIELVNQSRPLMVEKFFRELLYYPGENAATHLGRYPEYLNLNLNYPYFNVVVLEIENASQIEAELGITAYQMELLNIQDLIQEKCRIFDQTYLLKEFNSIACILAQKTSNPNHFVQVIHKIFNSFLDDYGTTRFFINIGIGQTASSLWKLHLSFESANHALKYRFFFPNQNIFNAKEALGRDFSLLSSTEQKEEELIQLLCQKDIKKIEQWLHNFFLVLSEKYPQKNMMFIKIYSLLGRILKFLYELNINTADIEAEIAIVYNKFDTFQTYEQFFEWMNHICNLVCQKLDSSLQTYHDQVCEMALGYIQENFEDNTLCLNDIALYTNVSAAYLSVLFKKVQGQSISDTIAALRIDSACKYLKHSALSLKEISTKCGYANQYYFSNSFKKRMGVSPSKYRDEHSEL